MPKKKQAKKIFESMQIESAEANAGLVESGKVEAEAISSDLIPQESAVETTESSEQDSGRKESKPALKDKSASGKRAGSEKDSSADDLLDSVRQSLMEEEVDEEDKKSKKWWRRAVKGLKKDQGVEVETPIEKPMEPLATAQANQVEEQHEVKPSEEYLDEIDELIDMLETGSDESANQATVVAEALPEPEATVDIDELKKQAFRPRGEGEEPESITEVRSIALEGGEEVFVEVESKRLDTAGERLSAFENALRPYRRYIYFGFAFLGGVMAIVAAFVMFSVYQRSQPPKPTRIAPDLPYPTAMSLPGGLNFTLARGALKDGEWNPRGPEWLEGTEVCRWVAIPWSRQLEAVIRTLNPDDPIELAMSNNDRLVYKVYSVRQLSPEELQRVENNSPCLLLILAEPDTEKRWVLTALP
jgi:hypothetical protein